MPTPDSTTALTQVSTAIAELLTEVTSTAPVLESVTEATLNGKFWSVLGIRDEADAGSTPGTGYAAFSSTYQLYYHAGAITAGAPGEVETHAREVRRAAIVKFQQRPYLACTTYTGGVTAIAPQGISVPNSEVITLARDNGSTDIGVRVDLTVPLLFQSDTIDL